MDRIDAELVRCPRCEMFLPRSMFGPDRNRRNGLLNRCRPCDNVKSREYDRRVRNPNGRSHAERRAARAAAVAARRAQPRSCRDCGVDIDRRLRLCARCLADIEELRRQQGGHRRRARRYGVAYVFIERRSICVRDRWICGLCDLPIPETAKYPDPRSASLDHIVPMSLGGPHLPHNVQASHLRCNLLKGARIADPAAASA